MNKQLIRRLIIISILVLALISTLVFFFAKSATLSIHVAPTDAVVTIKGKEYKNDTVQKFRPGKYVALISAPDFETKEIEITLEKNTTTDLNAYLLGLEDDFEYYKTNANDLYYLYEYLHTHPDDEAVSTFTTAYEKQQSIHDILPIFETNADINYYIFYETSLPSCHRLFCIKIGASNKAAANAALELIKSRGYDPNDYEIIYALDDPR